MPVSMTGLPGTVGTVLAAVAARHFDDVAFGKLPAHQKGMVYHSIQRPGYGELNPCMFTRLVSYYYNIVSKQSKDS